MTASAGWKKKGPLLLAVIVIAGLAAVTAWVRQPGDGTSAGKAQGEGEHAVSETGVSENQDSTLRASRRASATGPMSTAEMQQQVRSSIAQRTRMRDQQEREYAASKQKVAAAYRVEKVDQVWAQQKEAELAGVATSAALTETKIAPKAFDIDCKSTVCRLSGTFATNGDAEDWTLLYMASVGSALPNSVVSRTQNADGTTSVEIYGKAR